MTTHAVVDSPLGPLTLVDEDGALTGLFMDAQRHLPDPARFGARDDTVQGAAREQLAAYFAGELRHFTLELAPAGTPFQQEVWSALREVAYGELTTYAKVAAAVGRPAAVRAVGAAVGRNPVGIVVPCHRVVGSGGALTGYAGGLPRKRALLALEGSALF